MMTSLSFYFALLLLQANPAFYSSSSFCATDILLEQRLQDEEYAHKHQAFEKRLKAQIENGQIVNYRALYTLPVVVHVIHQGGAENISDAQVLQAIDDLNAAFANAGYYDQGTGLDTEIQFCLAQRDPDGNPTSGINRVNNALTSLTLETQDVAMKDLSRWNPLEYINIWVVGEICSSSVGCGVAGYAFFPSSHGMPEDGLVVESNYFGNSQANSAVLVHEMGHYLGVYHTFQNGCTNNDCLSDGDRVCDTPPDQSTVPVPCGQSVNTCSSDVNAADPNNPFTTDQNDMYWNYMDYGDVDCYSAFTPGQTDRMY
ncbi:MAG: M43 family zinc metalloprotease, partial [Saprospiraceae bacterium]|nr:M43 family zinc metalloprotease [Saprospiraceae bacterium]